MEYNITHQKKKWHVLIHSNPTYRVLKPSIIVECGHYLYSNWIILWLFFIYFHMSIYAVVVHNNINIMVCASELEGKAGPKFLLTHKNAFLLLCLRGSWKEKVKIGNFFLITISFVHPILVSNLNFFPTKSLTFFFLVTRIITNNKQFPFFFLVVFIGVNKVIDSSSVQYIIIRFHYILFSSFIINHHFFFLFPSQRFRNLQLGANS